MLNVQHASLNTVRSFFLNKKYNLTEIDTVFRYVGKFKVIGLKECLVMRDFVRFSITMNVFYFLPK